MAVNSEPPATKSALASLDSESVSEAVVTAVADVKGVSTVEVTPPLYHVIDPDALETLVASMTRRPDDSVGCVEFSYSGYEITITGEGHVSVTPEDPDSQ